MRQDRAQPASYTDSVATDGRSSQQPGRLSISRSSAATARNPTTPGQIAADTRPQAYPDLRRRPPPGLTEPTAERLAERADAADTGRLDTRRLDTRRLDTRRLERGRLDRRTGERTPNSGHGPAPDGVTGVLAFPTSATTLPYLGPPSEDSARQAPPAAIGNQDCLAVNTASAILAMAATRQLQGGTPRSRLRLGALLSSEDFGSRVERTAKLHPLWQA
jgi:hypothetical protein